MPTRFRHFCHLASTAIVVAFLFIVRASGADESPKPIEPRIEGRPILAMPGAIVVLPEHVERPPADYESMLGPTALGLITIEGMQLGEIYVARLKQSAAEEAKQMAASAKPGSPLSLLKNGQEKISKHEAEFVTLKIAADSKFGNPWIVHSVYLPRENGSITFKIVTSEQQFERLKPLLYATIDPIKNDNAPPKAEK